MSVSWTSEQWASCYHVFNRKLPLSAFPSLTIEELHKTTPFGNTPTILFHALHLAARGSDKLRWSPQFLCHGFGMKSNDVMMHFQIGSGSLLARWYDVDKTWLTLNEQEFEIHYNGLIQQFENTLDSQLQKSVKIPTFWRRRAINWLAFRVLDGFAEMVRSGQVEPTTGSLTARGSSDWKEYLQASSSDVALNSDCLRTVFKFMGLKHATMCIIAGRMVDTEEVGSIMRERCNPLPLLAKLVESPVELLWAMNDCGVLLSGSRAASFFYPDAVDSTSDWDFYTHPTTRHFLRFAIYLQSVGVEWDTNYTVLGANENPYDKVVLHGRTTNSRQERVQLIAHGINECSSISEILFFHSSIVQCFISGFAAVCFYASLTTSGSSRAWQPRYPYDQRLCESAQRAMDKYQARGIQYVGPQQNDPSIVPGYHARKLGDDESLCISLEPYLQDEIRGRNAKKDFDRLHNIRWKEFSYGTREETWRWYDFNDQFAEEQAHSHTEPSTIPVISPPPESLGCCRHANSQCTHSDLPADLVDFFQQNIAFWLEGQSSPEWLWI